MRCATPRCKKGDMVKLSSVNWHRKDLTCQKWKILNLTSLTGLCDKRCCDVQRNTMLVILWWWLSSCEGHFLCSEHPVEALCKAFRKVRGEPSRGMGVPFRMTVPRFTEVKERPTVAAVKSCCETLFKGSPQIMSPKSGQVKRLVCFVDIFRKNFEWLCNFKGGKKT